MTSMLMTWRRDEQGALSGDLESRVTTQYVRIVDDECDELLGDV